MNGRIKRGDLIRACWSIVSAVLEATDAQFHRCPKTYELRRPTSPKQDCLISRRLRDEWRVCGQAGLLTRVSLPTITIASPADPDLASNIEPPGQRRYTEDTIKSTRLVPRGSSCAFLCV